MATEEQLVVSAQEGSVAAFGKLVEMYQERLLRFLVGRCKSQADAEDAVQDTFINAHRYIRSYSPRWRFSTWLFRIALRNASKISRQHMDNEDYVQGGGVDPLEACIVASERENLWLVAKQALSTEAYSAMWLRYVEDLSVKEVAHTLDRSSSWTKVTLMRSRRRLSDELAGRQDTTANGEAYG